MLVLKANVDSEVRCITCWAECTTELFQRICRWEPEKKLEDRNPILLFSALTEKEYKIMLTQRDDELEAAIYQCIAFVYVEEMYFKTDKAPKTIKLRGKLIDIPQNLGSLTIEQNMHLRKALEKEPVLEACISKAMAVYLQPLVDGCEFDYDKAIELEKEILQLPIWQTYAVGFFFLSKLKPFGIFGLRDLNLLKQKLIRNVQKLLRWLRSKNLTSSTI